MKILLSLTTLIFLSGCAHEGFNYDEPGKDTPFSCGADCFGEIDNWFSGSDR